MIRPDGQFTELEARVLDLALVLHAEHGGGQQLDFRDPCDFFNRFRHVFSNRCSDRFLERTAARRCQPAKPMP